MSANTSSNLKPQRVIKKGVKQIAIQNPIWYATKNQMLQSSKGNIILARDAYNNCASKQYTSFETFDEFNSFIAKNTKGAHFYEVIPTDANHSVYLAFDVDRQLY